MRSTTAAAEGGAGGKIRKRPLRRSSTPYDRPSTAFRPATGNAGWISKLVNPASKLLTAGANRLLASLFRRRLPAPTPIYPLPPPPSPPHDSNQYESNKLQDAVISALPGQETEVVDGSCLRENSNGSGIAELEQILKQKTFTRSQIDRLTELLNASALEELPGNPQQRPESDVLASAAGQVRSANLRMKENGIWSQCLPGVTSNAPVSSKLFDEDAASPVELAKAYMDGRPSQVSPLMLGSHSQLFKERATLSNPSSPAFHKKTYISSPASESSFQRRLSTNGFTTPRSYSKSAIYRMVRTPDTRDLQMNALRVAKSTVDRHKGLPPPSSSHSHLEHSTLSDSAQVGQKRRSTIFVDDIGLNGPVRRIRQKSNLLLNKRLSLPVSSAPLPLHGIRVNSDSSRRAFPLIQRSHLLDESQLKTSEIQDDYRGRDIPGASLFPVPSQSRETAAKILEQLDLLVSSSLKEKSSELKLSTDRQASSSKSAQDKLHRSALRIEENVDTSKFLQGVGDNTNSDGSPKGCLPDVCGFPPMQIEKKNCKKKTVDSCETVSPLPPSSSTVPNEDTLRSRNPDSAFSAAVANPSRTKAFKMSAHEEYLDLEDDDTNEAPPGATMEGNGKLDSFAGSKAPAIEMTVENTPSPSEANASAKADIGIFDGAVVTEKNVIPASSSTAPTSVIQPATLFSQSAFAVNPLVTPNNSNTAPLFNFGAGAVNNLPDAKFLTPSIGESPRSISVSNAKLESLKSVAAERAQKIFESPGGGKSRQKDELVGKPSVAMSAALSTSSTSNFSFGIGVDKSSTYNGLLSSSSVVSSPIPVGDNSAGNQIFSISAPAVSSASLSTIISDAAPETVASSSSNSSVTAAPLFSSAPGFAYGSSAAPSATASLAALTSLRETAVTGDGTSKTGYCAVSGTSAGGSIFGFSTSNPSTANSQSLGTGSESMHSGLASSSGFSIVAGSPSLPIQFGSSAPSSIIGSLPSASTGSSFGSSSSFSNIFSSSSNFGLSSSAAAMEPNTNGSAIGGTMVSSFGSGWPPAKSPVFGSVLNSSPSTGFSFGLSSAASSGASTMAFGSSPMVFSTSNGVSSGSMFSFATAAAAATVQPNPVFGFGSAAGSGGNENNMNMEDKMAEDSTQASAPSFPVFGQPAAAPSSGFMFGSAAPSGSSPFQFGAQQQNVGTTPSSSPFQFGGQQSFNPFQPSGGPDLGTGGSFSLGSGGGAGKSSNRKMIKVRRKGKP